MKSICIGLLFFALAGCSADPVDTGSATPEQGDGHVNAANATVPDYITLNEETSRQAGLIASVRLPNQVVEWYSPLEGVLYMAEAGVAADNVRPVTNNTGLLHMLPTELYEFLSDSPAPQALRDIEVMAVEANAIDALRLGALVGTERGELSNEETEPAPAQPPLHTTEITVSSGTVTNGCAASWWQSNFCVQGSYTWMTCQTNRTTNYDANWNLTTATTNLDRAGAGVCAKQGSVQFSASFYCWWHTPSGDGGGGPFPVLCDSGGVSDNKSFGPYTVPQGTWRSFTRSADSTTIFWDDAFGLDISATRNSSSGSFALMGKSRTD